MKILITFISLSYFFVASSQNSFQNIDYLGNSKEYNLVFGELHNKSKKNNEFVLDFIDKYGKEGDTIYFFIERGASESYLLNEQLHGRTIRVFSNRYNITYNLKFIDRIKDIMLRKKLDVQIYGINYEQFRVNSLYVIKNKIIQSEFKNFYNPALIYIDSLLKLNQNISYEIINRLDSVLKSVEDNNVPENFKKDLQMFLFAANKSFSGLSYRKKINWELVDNREKIMSSLLTYWLDLNKVSKSIMMLGSLHISKKKEVEWFELEKWSSAISLLSENYLSKIKSYIIVYHSFSFSYKKFLETKFNIQKKVFNNHSKREKFDYYPINNGIIDGVVYY